MAAHSKLGASGAHRWWNCPGSIRMSEGVADIPSDYAREGTAAHALAERCISKGVDADEYEGWGIDVREGSRTRFVEGLDGGGYFTVDTDMIEAVQVFIDYTQSVAAEGVEWSVEQKLHLSTIDKRCFGTADFVAYNPTTKELTVADYKHGRGVAVEVEENPQLLYYAFGVATRYHNRGVDKVTVVVVQPRCPHTDGPVRKWSVDAVDLLEWSSDLRAAIKRTDEQDAPLAAGEWCKFCPAAPICPEFYNAALQAAAADFNDAGEVVLSDPTTFSGDALAERLRSVDRLEDWCRRLREYAHHEAESGRVPPGFKLVSKRPVRRFKEDERVRRYLQMSYGVEDEHLFSDPKMRSPAQMENVLRKHYGLKGKAATEAIADHVENVSSGTVLAPVEDDRPPVKPEASEEFFE